MTARRAGWISGAITCAVVGAGGLTGVLSVSSPTTARATALGVVLALSGALGLAAGIAASRLAAAARARDGAERLLAVATAGLPPRRLEWGLAMRAELAAISDADADTRWQFARSASTVAFRQGLGIRLGLPFGSGALTTVVAVAASRVQLRDGGPGVMAVTVPVPAMLLLLVALVAAAATRSLRIGLETGALTCLACFAAVSTVAATEGLVWMERRGTFVLDADPPRHTVGSFDVIVDFFSTGLWLGHLAFWMPWVLVGAWVGAWVGTMAKRESPGGLV